jgi:diguanylate cyclase (GGDEF)-like protein/PAS domain S-box-containing protein
MISQRHSRNNKADFTADEQTFRLMFEGHSAVMLLIEPETGAILDVNQAALDFYGYSRLKICSMLIGEINTLSAELVEAECQKAFKEERNHFVFSHKIASGEERVVEVHSSPIVLKKKKLLFSIIHDITERRQSENLLDRTRKNYETFFNSIDDFLFVLDDKGNILHTNKTVTDRLGYSDEELFGKSVLIVHPPERREEAGRIVGEMLAGTAEFCPVPIMTKAGQQIPVETRVTPGFWNDKPAIFGVTKDISQIKLSEEKFSKIFQSNSVLMALSGFDDGIYIDVNDLFLKTLGFMREEVIGKTSRELHLFSDADQRKKIIEEMKQRGAVKDIEVTIQTKDGSPRYGLFSADTIYVGKDPCLLTVMVDITERKLAEEALRESQLLYHSLVEVSPLSICRKDLTGRFTFANRRFLELSEMTLADLVGKTDFDLHPSELAEKYRRDDQAVMASRQVQELIEERAIHGGESVVVQSVKTPIYDGTGKVNGIQISFWDITERKRMEQALRESEEKYRTVANFTYDWEAWRAADGAYLYISPSCERVSGYAAVNFVDDENFILKIMHPDDKAKVGEHFSAVFHQSIPQDVNLDFRIITPDGETRWISHHCTAVYSESGQWLGRRESNRDITGRKLVEQELKTQRDFATLVINTMGQGLTVTNAEGRFEFVNPAYARLFGYETADLIGKLPSDMTIFEDQPLLDEQRVQRQLGKTSTYESRLRRADGSFAHVLITGVPREHGGCYAGSVAVITDLTEQKRVQTELRRAKDALEAAYHKLKQTLVREQQLARTDSLTGINNRGYFFELATRKFNVAIRYRLPLSMLMFDIDHFKQINDAFGHVMGDQVLKKITQVVFAEIRLADVIGRYGGDEFVVLLPHTSEQEALSLAERIHSSISAVRIETDDGPLTLTISIGITQTTHHEVSEQQRDTVENLFLRADQALYAAKQAGRNCTMLFDS